MDYLYRPDLKNKVVQMLPFITLLSIDKTSNQPVYLQIANNVVNIIREGQIKPGTMLPGTRELARLLNIHRKTAIAAYDELYAQSWIEVVPRKGARIAQNLPDLQPQRWNEPRLSSYGNMLAAPFYRIETHTNIPSGPVLRRPDFIIDEGYPDSRLAPLDLLNRAYRSRAKQNTVWKWMPGSLAGGSPLLRTALVGYLLESRGLDIQDHHTLITHGAQMSIYIAASLLLKPGDAVIVADPSYFLANKVFESLGARLVRVPVDGYGMDMDAVEQACKKNQINALYVIPHHHHPTTVTLSPERRMRLLELSRRFDFTIIEDDYDYEFHYNSAPFLPLASSQHDGRVIYIGSFSKSIAPSVRVGFMIAPADFIRQAIQLRMMIDLRGDHILEDALAELIHNGDIGRYLKKANKAYFERRDHLCLVLETELKGIVDFDKPSGGMALWARFNKDYPLIRVADAAAAKGLLISRGFRNHGNLRDDNSIRMGFASLEINEMNAAIEILTGVLKPKI
ncbi:PLP-dependent aminotransferase family protein [Pedobacter steynii]|nr:PLP-dependent aminotransferase family protein [Pedobacter steynii]